MALSRKQVVDAAVSRYRGALGQPDDQARADAVLDVSIQPWSAADRDAVLDLFDQLLRVQGDPDQEGVVITRYLSGSSEPDA